MLREVLAWWWRQLSDLLPARWRQARSGPQTRESVVLVLSEPSPGEAGTVEVTMQRPRGAGRLGRFGLDGKGLTALRAAIGPSRRGPVRLAVPPRLLLEQQVTLPLAAERELDTVLRYEMDRLTPFAADSVFWSWRVESRDRQRGRVALRLRLVPKAAVEGVLEGLASVGLRPALIESAAEPERSVSLTGGHAGSRRPRGLALAAFACVALAVAAVAVPFIQQELASRRLDARIAALRPDVDAADALRSRFAQQAGSADVVAAEGARVGDALRVLADVTEVLPDDTHLFELTLRDRVLTISGEFRCRRPADLGARRRPGHPQPELLRPGHPQRAHRRGNVLHPRGDAPLMPVPFLPCMALVAQIYSLPPRVLPSIQRVEGGAPGLVHLNANGTEDLGIMQINTIWLPYLSRYTHLPEAEVRARLLGRACFNIAASGLIVRIYLDETGGDLLRAVGDYHSHTPALNQDYQTKVLRSATLLFSVP